MRTYLIYANGKRGGIPGHHFQGNNGTPEEYSTDDPEQIASLEEWDAAVFQEDGPTGVVPEPPKKVQQVRVGPVTTYQEKPEPPDPSMEVESDEEPATEEEVDEGAEEVETATEEAPSPKTINPEAYKAQVEKIVERLREAGAKNSGKNYYTEVKSMADKYGIPVIRRKREEVYQDIAKAHLDSMIAKAQGGSP